MALPRRSSTDAICNKSEGSSLLSVENGYDAGDFMELKVKALQQSEPGATEARADATNGSHKSLRMAKGKCGCIAIDRKCRAWLVPPDSVSSLCLRVTELGSFENVARSSSIKRKATAPDTRSRIQRGARCCSFNMDFNMDFGRFTFYFAPLSLSGVTIQGMLEEAWPSLKAGAASNKFFGAKSLHRGDPCYQPLFTWAATTIHGPQNSCRWAEGGFDCEGFSCVHKGAAPQLAHDQGLPQALAIGLIFVWNATTEKGHSAIIFIAPGSGSS